MFLGICNREEAKRAKTLDNKPVLIVERYCLEPAGHYLAKIESSESYRAME